MVVSQKTDRTQIRSRDGMDAGDREPISAVSEDSPMEDQGLMDFDTCVTEIRVGLEELDKKDPTSITSDDVQPLCAPLDFLKELSALPTFKLTVQKRPSQVLHMILRAYRYHTPSLPSSQLSDAAKDTLMASLKPCLHSVIRVTIAQEEFAKECLGMKLTSRDEAFSMTLVLCMVTTGITKLGVPGKTPGSWWLLIDASGHLLLMKQYLSCIGLLSKEICTPVYMKIKDDKLDVYFYVLTSASMMVLTLLSKPMSACVLCLMDTLKETKSSLAALFVSDLLAFISRIAATPFTLDLIKAVLHITGSVFRTRNDRRSANILIITCGRLMNEISPDEQALLVEQFPIRRHFFFWSHFPPSTFLNQPDIIKGMWGESLSIIGEVTAGCPKSAASATFMLCRLPLALQCLYNLEQLAKVPEFNHPGIKEYRQKVLTSFMPVFRILVAVPDRVRLPLVQTSVCLLLKMGSLIQSALQDKDITDVLEAIVSCPDEVTFLGASSFIVAVGRRRPLRGTMPGLVQKFFAHHSVSKNPWIKNATALALLDFSSWVECEKLISECGKLTDMELTLRTFEKQVG
ncbi:hypothetical protein RvY_17752 [Ramazzottius varieornatus]|uniref:Uncharacterized protein n=1 Tax=Ramazzottius varieornatus TaxID=947166 RepID=A0A1D1W3A4_RAMVA|nr:hypothetical protein RvY_17752 [Ramazzottius varieornatus]